MRLTLGILGVFFTVVVAPPPLDVELRAEKEYLEKLKFDQEDTLDTFGDNLIPDTEEKAIEDTDAEYPVVLKHDEAEFVPLAFSNKFDKYDENNDDFIDEGELITVIGVSENIALALKDADNDGDGLLSRDEFENGPWDLDAADLPDVESIDDLGDENEDLIDKEFIDYDSDTFNDILEADDGMIDADNEIIDDFIETGDDFKEKMEDLHEEMNKDGENDVTEKAKEIVGDLKESINDVQEKVNEIHEDMVEKVGN